MVFALVRMNQTRTSNGDRNSQKEAADQLNSAQLIGRMGMR